MGLDGSGGKVARRYPSCGRGLFWYPCLVVMSLSARLAICYETNYSSLCRVAGWNCSLEIKVAVVCCYSVAFRFLGVSSLVFLRSAQRERVGF